MTLPRTFLSFQSSLKENQRHMWMNHFLKTREELEPRIFSLTNPFLPSCFLFLISFSGLLLLLQMHLHHEKKHEFSWNKTDMTSSLVSLTPFSLIKSRRRSSSCLESGHWCFPFSLKAYSLLFTTKLNVCQTRTFNLFVVSRELKRVNLMSRVLRCGVKCVKCVWGVKECLFDGLNLTLESEWRWRRWKNFPFFSASILFSLFRWSSRLVLFRSKYLLVKDSSACLSSLLSLRRLSSPSSSSQESSRFRFLRESPSFGLILLLREEKEEWSTVEWTWLPCW